MSKKTEHTVTFKDRRSLTPPGVLYVETFVEASSRRSPIDEVVILYIEGKSFKLNFLKFVEMNSFK